MRARTPALPTTRAAARRAFSLLEVVFAITIVAVALIGLQATVSGSILVAGDAINQRAARELARAKLEEILAKAAAGVDEADGSGAFEQYPQFNWSSRSEERNVGPEESMATVRVVILELSFPVEGGSPEGAGGDPSRQGRETITLASVLPAPPPQGAPR